MRLALVLLAAALGGSCAMTSQARYQRQNIALSPWCTLTLIRDMRTGTCLAAYTCGVRGVSPGVVVVPPAVCEP
jgi:hypothetical protein